MESSELPIDDAVAGIIGAALKLEGFFPEFTADHLTHLFRKSRLASYPPGFHVIEQGQTGRDLFVICKGRVAVNLTFGAAGAQVAELKEGGVFGEIGLIRDGVRTATVIAAVESQIFRLAYEDLTYLLTNNPAMAEHLKSLAQKRQN